MRRPVECNPGQKITGTNGHRTKGRQTAF